jgi:glycerol kinase
MAYIMAMDQGTTSSRAVIIDASGSIVAVAQKELPPIFPQPGWVEHDPNEIWSTQAGVASEVLERAGLRAADIAAVGITNQRETTIAWDRATGRPLGNAIVWQDRRTASTCERLRASGLEEMIRTKTGLVLDAYFSATKIAWMLDRSPEIRRRAEQGEIAFGTVDSWLAYKLTGRTMHITDVSNASRTMLFNLHALDWDDELLEKLSIPRCVLADVHTSSEVYGEIVASPALAGVPLAAMIGDQQAATMGQMCIMPGLAKNTYGTGCFLLMNTGDGAHDSRNRLLTTIAWQRGQKIDYALEGSVFVGGAIVQWLRDGLKIIRDASEIEALARRVDSSEGVYLVPALSGLGAPHWDPHARGTIIGLTRGTTDAHIARAALEGIAFQVADLVSAMEDDAGEPLTELRVDGGAAANDLLMQLQADILGVPVVRPTVLETTSLGAGYLAGLAVGYWSSLDQISANWQVDRRFEPTRPRSEVEAMRAEWREAVARSRGWAAGGPNG